jgi:pimeloyl-ACP methyl ester carboxylesterase
MLAIRGGLSDVLSEVTFDRMAQVKPDLRRVVVPNVGHVPALDEPEAATAIHEFITNF